MLAIAKALEWTALNLEFLEKKEITIFSDSMSSLEALKSQSTSKYADQENRIYRTAELIEENGANISLQYVPSHIDLAGNDEADQTARESHNIRDLTPCPLSIEEGKRKVKKAAEEAWKIEYYTKKNMDNLKIGDIKPEIGYWPWTTHQNRAVETALARLRISHIELNNHLHRFRQADSPLCQICRTPETIDHYLLTCRRYTPFRQSLYTSLNENGITGITKKTLLGGGNYDLQKQKIIIEAVGTYLKERGRLYGFSTN